MTTDSYGPDRPIEASGGLEYRYDITRPDWSTSEKRVSDLAEILLDVEQMGRKRNPKKELLSEVMTEWPEADAYVALRALLGKRFPHPEVNISVDTNAVYEALGRVFGPDGAGEEWGGQYSDQHDNTTQGLMHEKPDHPDDGVDPIDPTLDVFWGQWMYRLAQTDGPNKQADYLEEFFRRLEKPWMLAQAVLNNLTLYCGSYMMLKAIRNTFEVEEPWRCWRTTGDLPAFFLEARRGTASPGLEPHGLHNTMKAESTSASTVASEEFDDEQWLGQVKYDGARLFVHHDGEELRAYTGGGNDVTAALPELDEIDWPDCEFIFDAEATPYDEDGNVVPFENVMTRITREPGSGGFDVDDFDTEVVCKFFDCPYWKGRDISERRYDDRFTIVQSVFDPKHVARTGDDLEETFHRSVEDGHEGLVLKRKDGEYMPGGRHDQWLKWKPEPETLDVKVLDAQMGGGRISDRMGALKVGLDYEGGNVPVGWVGTGFSDEERKEFWQDYEMDRLEGQLIEIEFEELQPNGSSWGLRFPSFERRRDSMEASVDTLERAARLQGREEEFRDWDESVDEPSEFWFAG